MSCLSVIFGTLLFTQSLQAATLYFTNNSHEVAKDITDYVVSFDTVSHTTKGYKTSIPSGDEILSGAIICGDMYYAVWVDVLTGNGVFSFNITSGQLATYANTKNNYHVFACTNTPNVILGVSNDFSSTPVYYLDRVTFSGSTNSVQTDIIGTFEKGVPYGYDTIFSFNPDNTELWASFPNSDTNPKTGTLQIMDTSTGKLKNTYDYPRDGVPYFTLPETLKGSSFKGAVSDPSDNTKITFGTFTISGSSLKMSDTIKANYLYSSSMPQAVCNGTGYVIGDPEITMVSYDIETGKEIEEYNMALYVSKAQIGGIACLE